MTITHWLLALAGILIAVKHKQVLRMFSTASNCHYLVLAALALWFLLFVAFAGTTIWLLREYGLKGLIGPAIFIFGYTAWCRIVKGRWPGDDTLHLD